MFKKLFQSTPRENAAEQSESAQGEQVGEQESPVASAVNDNVQEPPPANELLVQAMMAVAQSDNPTTRAALYQAFLQGHFWMPIVAPPAGLQPGQNAPQNAEVQVPGLQDQEGNKLLAVFTDAEALAAFIPDSPYLAVPTMDFFRMAAGTDIAYVAVNPWPPQGQPVRPGGRLMRFEFEALAQGRTPQIQNAVEQGQVAQGQQVSIARADAPLPEAAVTELKKAAQYEPILKIYYLQLQMHPNPATKALAFELTHTPPQTVIRDMFEALANRLRPYMQETDALQFITVEGAGAEQCRQAGETLYVRER